MTDETKESQEEIQWITKVRKRLFSDEPLTKGEIIQILAIIMLIAIILYVSFSTKCSLDCSMCSKSTQTLIQRGIG